MLHLLPTQTAVAWVGFSGVFMYVSVSLSVFPHDVSKTDAAIGLTNLT